jgi:MerR family transcriptional regulator/heat shock protein HspR
MVVQEVDARKFMSEGRGAVTGNEPDAARGVYGISVAAELVGTGVQNLRAYEARGLLEPERTEGGTRRYSANDLERLRRIGHLLEAGLNLAGIAMVMDLQDENSQLRAEKEEQQWLQSASIPASSSRKGTSSSSRSRSTHR